MSTFNALLGDSTAVGRVLDCSRRHVENLDAEEKIPRPIRLGRLKKWDLSIIEKWVAAGCPSRSEWESREAGK